MYIVPVYTVGTCAQRWFRLFSRIHAIMLNTFRPFAFSLAALLAAGSAAHAQTSPAPLSREEPVYDRTTQRVEHIEHEDSGSRIEEVRAGGQTQRIRVQPKASVPAYEVQPPDMSGRTATGESGPGSAGRRVWKISF